MSRAPSRLFALAAVVAAIGGAACTPTTPPPSPVVHINEVESSGGTPGDWVEIANLGDRPAALSGYVISDDDDTHRYTIPAGTRVPVGGYLVVDEAALGFGLGSADSVRLFKPSGSVVDEYSWSSHAVTSFGRCPDATGPFVTTAAPTKGAPNDCPGPVTTVHINEVESSGGTPGDWVELVNVGAIPVDLSGWSILDNDDTHTPAVLPAGTTIANGGYLVVEEAALGFGLGSADSVRLFDQTGGLYESTSWSAHAPTTWGRCPNGTGSFVTTTSSTKSALNDCGNPVRINEVESSGGSPGDWVELFNPGGVVADLSGATFSDNDDTHAYVLPTGTLLAPGAYLVLEEATFGFGLGSADSARLFDATAAPIDAYSWTAHAATTFGRCPNGTGSFATTTASTKGAANACPGDLVTSPWPGGAAVTSADGSGVLGTNISGLAYQGSGSASPGVLWAVKNGPGTLHRLVSDGSTWAPDGGDWAAGKALRYPGGVGDPDAEGVTLAEGSVFVSTERNNAASSVSRNSILRFDPSQAGSTLTATGEWDLTSALPVTGANLGMEAVAWVPDSWWVAGGFVDQTTGAAYDPADYPTHGSGLFVVGLESTSSVYVFALDLAGAGSTLIATSTTPFVGVMDLSFDADRGDLWVVCDDGCQGRTTRLDVNGSGALAAGTIYERPTGMPNLNNEGFATASVAECASDVRPVFWSDDANTDGHAVRVGTVSCSTP